MESLKVKDYMNSRPVVFDLEMTVAEAVEKLLQSGQIGGPVLGENHKVIGFVSEQDCLKKMIESTYYREQAGRVKDVYRTDVLTVNTYDSILELGQQMLGAKPKIYPVVDDDHQLVGIISRRDVLKAIDVHLQDEYHAE